MNGQILVVLILSVFKISLSSPVKEKIKPVELKYYCVKVKAAEEKVHEKIPVLLIHGLGGSHKNWDGINLHLALRTHSKVCSVDLRNHGDSPWNNRNDVKAHVVDIGHFLDKQGIKKVNIIGHSLGGKIAVHYSLNNPSRVNSIVVEDMRPNGVVKEEYDKIFTLYKIFKEALDKIPAGGTEEQAREKLVDALNQKTDEMGMKEKFTVKSLIFLEFKIVGGKWRFKQNIDAILKVMKDENTFLGKSSGLYTGPALFIYGTQSGFKVGEDKTNILKLFPKAKLVPVEGAGHIIHGNFHEFDDEVVKFLNEVN